MSPCSVEAASQKTKADAHTRKPWKQYCGNVQISAGTAAVFATWSNLLFKGKERCSAEALTARLILEYRYARAESMGADHRSW